MFCMLSETKAYKAMTSAKRCSGQETVYVEDMTDVPYFNYKFADKAFAGTHTPVRVAVYRVGDKMVISKDLSRSKTFCNVVPLSELMSYSVDNTAFLEKVGLVDDEGNVLDKSCCRKLDFDASDEESEGESSEDESSEDEESEDESDA